MKPSAGIILLLGGKVLLLQGLSGIWSFPKGHGEDYDLTPIDTAVREMEEETGYRLNIDYELVGDAIRLDKKFYWHARPLRSLRKPTLDAKEHKDCRWVPVEDLAWFNTNGGVRVWARRL